MKIGSACVPPPLVFSFPPPSPFCPKSALSEEDSSSRCWSWCRQFSKHPKAKLESKRFLSISSASKINFPKGKKKKGSFFFFFFLWQMILGKKKKKEKKKRKTIWVMNAAISNTDNCMRSFCKPKLRIAFFQTLPDVVQTSPRCRAPCPRDECGFSLEVWVYGVRARKQPSFLGAWPGPCCHGGAQGSLWGGCSCSFLLLDIFCLVCFVVLILDLHWFCPPNGP